MQLKQNFRNVIVSLLAVFIVSCSHSAKKPSETQSLTTEMDIEYSKQLTHALDKKFGIWKDPIVEKILAATIQKISLSDPELKESSKNVHIVILNSSTPFALPGLNNIIYVSKGALASVEYENELAFLICTPLIMIEKKIPEKRFETLFNEEAANSVLVLPIQPKVTRIDFLNSGWFDNNGFFDVGVTEYLKADKEAVAVPPKALFDHRGGLSLYQRYSQEPLASMTKALIKYSPNIVERFENIKEETARILPIRDAILKSKAMRDYKNRFKEKG